MAKRPPPDDPPYSEVPGESDDYPGDDLASVVRVSRDEDVAAICGRVDTAPTYAVVVHAPRGNRALATELGMRRLQRHAEEYGKMVAVASGSVALTSRARQAGIPTARRPDQVRWDAGGYRVFRFFGASVRLPAVGRYIQYAIFLVIVLGIGFAALSVVPKATVVAYPPTETLERLVTVTASSTATEIDFDQLIVPSEEVSADTVLTLAVRTTGSADAPVLGSRVVVTITNPTSADVVLPANTVMVTNIEGITFTLDEATTVPAGGTVNANAGSVQRGITTNVPAGSVTAFQDETYQTLTVTNSAVASGGTNEARPAVDAADVVSILALAEEIEVSDTVREALVKARPHDAVFLKTATTSIDLGEPYPAVGTVATVLTLDVTITITADAILETTLDELARAVLVTDEGSGTFIPGTVTAVETGASQVNPERGTVRTQLRMRGEFARDITEDGIADAVKGKSEDDARSTLAEQYGIQDTELKLTPGFAPWIPRVGFRIDVELKSRLAEEEDEPAEEGEEEAETPEDGAESEGSGTPTTAASS